MRCTRRIRRCISKSTAKRRQRRHPARAGGRSGDDVRQKLAFDLGDLILQHQLALFQALHWKLVKWRALGQRSEEHTSELQSLMRISYAVFCLKKKIKQR